MPYGAAFKATAAAGLLALGFSSTPALAGGGPDNIDYAAFNAAVVEDYVLPRYAAFAEATAILEASLEQGCADGRLETSESAGAFHAAMDSWMEVQHLRFGPSVLFLRTERIEFWPDKRGTVRRHLGQVLSDRNTQGLEPDVFAAGSVAVQGFPALERLLFDSAEAVWDTPFGCNLVIAIGRNLSGIASALLADWRDGEAAYAGVMKSAGKGNANYIDAKEASLEFAKALRGALLLAADYKLDRPLGETAKSAKPKRAESWRSARSLRNIAVNLEAARALYEDSGAVSFSSLVRAQPQGAELDDEIRNAFDRLLADAAALPRSLAAALETPDGWERLDALRNKTRRLLDMLGAPLSQVLELPIGFNSYDGD